MNSGCTNFENRAQTLPKHLFASNSMFLTLNPSQRHPIENSIGPDSVDSVSLNVVVQSHGNDIFSKDKENIPGHGSVDGTSLNSAVQPHGNVTVFNGMSRWLANGSLKAVRVPANNGNPAAQTHAITLESTVNGSVHFMSTDSMLADNIVSLVATFGL